jgi:signal transduction histidine kinase
MNIPNNQDFATEVKFDRLKILWRVTIVLSLIAGWVVLNSAMLQRMDLVRPLLPVALMIAGSLLTRFFLGRNRYTAAAWTYILAALTALTLLLTVSPLEMINVYVFFYALIIFIVGLLLPPTNTLLLALVSSILLTVIPATVLGGMGYFGAPQIGAIIMTFLAAIIAMQVTGDLYQIAEWAIQNYQRERRVAAELFDSRQEVEKGFVRARALSERLQETNVELDAARSAAEDAKHFRGQFLANMSHELRTPLNAIIGFSETMLKFPAMYDGVKLPNAYEADLQQIYTSGKQLLNLINDILDLAKVDAGKLDIRIERLDLKPVINSVLSTASGLLAGKPIRLETDLPDDIPHVWADEARVRQVLLNLYSNAAKFTDHGAIKIIVRPVDDVLQISIADTGVGISEADLGIIFEEFKQASGPGRDPRSGAGLGLAICRQLLALMDGRIWAESTVGKGSTFHVVVPLYAGQDALIAAPEAPAEQLVLSN